jgi:hypothetical protein
MKVTEIAQDILLIEDALPLDLIEKIKDKVIETNEMNCVKLYDHKEIFNEFMDYWYSTLEVEFMKFWLYLKEDGTSDLYKYSIEDLNKIKDHAKTIWRDLYILIYHKDNSNGLNNIVHADFSNYTFSCGLTDASEFEGGELVFPRQNFSMKINKGQMLIFPGGLTHPHYTKDVISGTRFQFIGQSAPQKQDKTLY